MATRTASLPNRLPRPEHPRTALIVYALLAGFTALDRLVIHPALVAATQGAAPSWTAAILEVVGETGARTLPAYENVVTRVTVVLVALAVFFTLGARRLGLDRFFDRHVGEAKPQVLGFLRIVTGAVLFAHIVVEDIAGTAYYPASLVLQHGFFGLLNEIPGVPALFLSPPFMAAFEWVALTAAGLACIGLFTRYTVAVAALTYFICMAVIRQPSWSFHLGLIPWFAMTTLAFFPSGDALSIDAWWRRRQGTAVVPDEARRRFYGWGRFAWVGVLTIPYFEAGLSKLSDGGPTWGSANNMRNILYTCSLNDMQLDFDLGLRLAHWPDAFYTFLGTAAVLGEVAMVLTLFSRFGRLVFPAMMFLMHFGIMLTQNILFWDLMAMLGAIYVLPIWDREGGPWDPRPFFRRVLGRDRGRKITDATLAGPPRPSRPPLGLVGFALVAAVCWVSAIEFFPLTAMQMFSRPRNPPGRVQYYHLFAEHEDGRRVRARPDDVLLALRAPRFRRAYKMCFRPGKEHICEDTLDRLMELHNAQAAPGDRIIAYEIEHREWDFLADPDDPDHGKTYERYRYSGASTGLAAAPDGR